MAKISTLINQIICKKHYFRHFKPILDMTTIELGQNIRKIRELKGFSQQNIADSIETTQKQLSRIENGQTSPTFDVLIKITQALEVGLNELLNFNENFIFNNFTTNQQGGKFVAYNNTEIEHVEKLYKQLLAEKDKVIRLLER